MKKFFNPLKMGDYMFGPQTKKNITKNVLPTNKSNQISVAFWSWMPKHGVDEVCTINTKMNSVTYTSLLEYYMLPSVRRRYPRHEVPIIKFIQDNSSVHTLNMTKQWFNNYPEVLKIDQPAKFPELNLKENIWRIIVKCWRPEEERTKKGLKSYAERMCQGLVNQPEICENLVNSIPCRLHELVVANGYELRGF